MNRSSRSSALSQDSRRPTLRRNITRTFVGNLLYSLSQFGILIAISRIGSPAMLGQYALALAMTTPVFMLCNMHLKTVQSTDLVSRFDFEDYLGLRVATTALALIVLAVWIGLSAAGEWAVLGVVSLTKAIESFSDLLHGELQREEDMGSISLSLTVRGVVGVIVFGVVLALTRNLLPACIGLLVVSLFVLLFIDLASVDRNLTILHPRFQFGKLTLLLSLALPSGFVVAANSWVSSIPRFVLRQFHGEAALGFYSAAAYFMVAANIVILAMNQPALPRLARLVAGRDERGFSRLLTKLTLANSACGVLGVVATLLLGPLLLRYVYGPEYAPYSTLMTVVMTAAAIRFASLSLTVAARARHQLRQLTWIHALEVVAVIVLSLALVPRWGAMGAAWAVVGAGTIECGLMTWSFLRTRRHSDGPDEAPVDLIPQASPPWLPRKVA